MCERYNFSVEELREIREIIQEVNEKLKDKKIKTGEIYPTSFVPPVLLPGRDRLETSAMT